MRLGIYETQSVVSGYPEVALTVLFDAGDAIVGQSALHTMVVHAMFLEVIDVQTVVRAYAHFAAKFTGNAYRGAVIGTVAAIEG